MESGSGLNLFYAQSRICRFLYEIYCHSHYISSRIYKTKELFSNLWASYYLHALFVV